MPDEAQRYGGTMAPLIVKDMVIAGVSGGDWGIRGFLSAYKAATGERVWRHWTIPAKGDPGFETWKGTAVATGGGGTWQTGSYDPETDTLYWATGNPWPNSDDRERGGDNLFTDCVLALDPATGKLKWYTSSRHMMFAIGMRMSPMFSSTPRIAGKSESCSCMRTGTVFSTSSIAPMANCCSLRNSFDG